MGLRKIILDDADFELILMAIECELTDLSRQDPKLFGRLLDTKTRLKKQLEIAGGR